MCILDILVCQWQHAVHIQKLLLKLELALRETHDTLETGGQGGNSSSLLIAAHGNFSPFNQTKEAKRAASGELQDGHHTSPAWT